MLSPCANLLRHVHSYIASHICCVDDCRSQFARRKRQWKAQQMTKNKCPVLVYAPTTSQKDDLWEIIGKVYTTAITQTGVCVCHIPIPRQPTPLSSLLLQLLLAVVHARMFGIKTAILIFISSTALLFFHIFVHFFVLLAECFVCMYVARSLLYTLIPHTSYTQHTHIHVDCSRRPQNCCSLTTDI